MSRWFRHYAGMMRDEKLVRVALRAKQPVERVVWVWGAILESAAEINDDGRYELDAAEVGYFLRTDEADIAAIADALDALGRVSQGRVAKWGDRQFQSDRSNERVRAHRERKRQVGGDGDGRETFQGESVTAGKRYSNAPETETETEKKDSVPNGTGASAPKSLDPKTILFREGLPLLAELTGREPKALRPVLGRWMKLTGEDCGAVLAEIERCRGSPVADPVSWIEARLKPKDADAKRSRTTNAEQSAAAMARVLARLDGGGSGDAASSGAGDGDTGPGIGDRGLREPLALAVGYEPR